jgi:starch synthase
MESAQFALSELSQHKIKPTAVENVFGHQVMTTGQQGRRGGRTLADVEECADDCASSAIFGYPGRSERRLKVGIATSGRFHLLDIARELDALGVKVDFYSYVSRKRAASFGLPRRCHVALLALLFPIVAWERIFPRIFPLVLERLLYWALDVAVIIRLRKCDVFICMSGLYLNAARYARWRYGALIHLHRSSRHILSQKEILARLPGAQQVSSFVVRRELQGYALADTIVVPSTHVAESFLPWPSCAAKIFINPLGVDIDQFPLRSSPGASDPKTVLFVGQWSYRKGVDVLVEAMRGIVGVRLLHVGILGDAPFPSDPRFVHHDHVPQRALTDFYGSTQVLVLPSREDGFGVVLSQALSSGRSVVCSDMTGGLDLVKLTGLTRLIHIVPAENSQALRRALTEALIDASGATDVAPISEAERKTLGWESYANRDVAYMYRALATKWASS